MKRTVSLLLLLTLVLALGASAMAADVTYAVTGGNISFDLATGTVTGCGKNVTEAVIPSEIYGVKVTAIGDEAFYDCEKLTSVTIPNTVQRIGASAFKDSGLTQVTVPSGVRSLGSWAFGWCRDLTAASLPGTLTEIGERTFEWCDELTKVTLGNGIPYLSDAMFMDCRALPSLTLPDSITAIGKSAFRNCPFTSIRLPDACASIEEGAFYNCTELESVKLGSGLKTIGKEAFTGCESLTGLQIPPSVTKLSWGAFRGSGITSINIPEGITELPQILFRDCSSLEKIYLPASITTIPHNAFWSTYSLSDVYYGGSVAQWALVTNDSEDLATAMIHFNCAGIESSWAETELAKAVQKDLVPEVLAGQDLTKTITRAEFAAVAVKVYEALSGKKAVPAAANTFSDTADPDVLKAYNTGLVNGLGDGKFGPEENLQRQQAATMLARAYKAAMLSGWTLADDAAFPLSYTMPAAFTDNAGIQSWAYDNVYFMVANGILNGMGDGTFAPAGSTTREQALLIAVRMVEKLG